VRALRVALGVIGHQRAALGARLGRWTLPHGEVALRIPVAAVEGLPPAGPLDHDLALVALRARDPGALLLLLDVLAVRVPRAPDERAVPAHAREERLAALRARLAGLLGLRPLLAVHVPGVLAVR